RGGGRGAVRGGAPGLRASLAAPGSGGVRGRPRCARLPRAARPPGRLHPPSPDARRRRGVGEGQRPHRLPQAYAGPAIPAVPRRLSGAAPPPALRYTAVPAHVQAPHPVGAPLSARPGSLLARLGLHRGELRAWAMYDWANSVFMTSVIALFPIYFSTV